MIDTVASLDNPAWHALTHQHAALALGGALARRYPQDVSPFGAVAANDAESFASLAALITPGETVGLVGDHPEIGATWALLRQFSVVQMVYDGARLEPEAAPSLITPLSPDDVPAMLALVDATHPGPFLPRTIAMGRYWAIWQDGRLAAMAGERFHLPGFREISAVCTHPDFQRRGYARQLVRHLIREIQGEGEVPFLHVFPGNAGAITLYETMGFRQREELPLFVVQRQ